MLNYAFKFSVVILTYNNYTEVTEPCLRSVLSNIDPKTTEIIIVDNCSKDCTVDEVDRYIESLDKKYSIKFQKNKANLGYAAGNNVGIKIASGEFIVLLNNDTLVSPGWLDGMHSCFELDPILGLVGPITNSVGNEQIVHFPSITNENYLDIFEGYREKLWPKIVETSDLGFFCVMMRHDAVNQVGMLDEGFGIGMFEDTDYCVRVSKAGFKLAFTQEVFIYHHGSFSFDQHHPEKYKTIFDSNLNYFISKHGEGIWGVSKILDRFWRLHKKILLECNQENIAPQLQLRLCSIDALIESLIQVELNSKLISR